jgi:hypothetical protein
MHRHWNSSKGQLSIGKKSGNRVSSQDTNRQRCAWCGSICKEHNFRSSHESHGFVTSGYY